MKNRLYNYILPMLIFAIANLPRLDATQTTQNKEWHEPLVTLYYKSSKSNKKNTNTTMSNKKNTNTTISYFKKAIHNISNIKDITKKSISKLLKKNTISEYHISVIKLYFLFTKTEKDQTLTTKEITAAKNAIIALYNKSKRSQNNIKKTAKIEDILKIVSSKSNYNKYDKSIKQLAEKLQKITPKDNNINNTSTSNNNNSINTIPKINISTTTLSRNSLSNTSSDDNKSTYSYSEDEAKESSPSSLTIRSFPPSSSSSSFSTNTNHYTNKSLKPSLSNDPKWIVTTSNQEKIKKTISSLSNEKIEEERNDIQNTILTLKQNNLEKDLKVINNQLSQITQQVNYFTTLEAKIIQKINDRFITLEKNLSQKKENNQYPSPFIYLIYLTIGCFLGIFIPKNIKTKTSYEDATRNQTENIESF